MMVIDNKFELKEIVFLKTDPDQRERIITELRVFPDNILYSICCGTEQSLHYDFELSKEKCFVREGE